MIEEERDEANESGKEGARRCRSVEVPPWYSPGIKKTTENLPRVAGYERYSNAGLPIERFWIKGNDLLYNLTLPILMPLTTSRSPKLPHNQLSKQNQILRQPNGVAARSCFSGTSKN